MPMGWLYDANQQLCSECPGFQLLFLSDGERFDGKIGAFDGKQFSSVACKKCDAKHVFSALPSLIAAVKAGQNDRPMDGVIIGSLTPL
jgi:hypothetical protein